jgi:hypothetical protein
VASGNLLELCSKLLHECGDEAARRERGEDAAKRVGRRWREGRAAKRVCAAGAGPSCAGDAAKTTLSQYRHLTRNFPDRKLDAGHEMLRVHEACPQRQNASVREHGPRDERQKELPDCRKDDERHEDQDQAKNHLHRGAPKKMAACAAGRRGWVSQSSA